MAGILGCKNLKYLPLDITAKTLNGIYERESCITTTVTLYAKKLFSNGKESLILMDFCWWRDRLNKRNVLKCESFFPGRWFVWWQTWTMKTNKRSWQQLSNNKMWNSNLIKFKLLFWLFFSFGCIFQWNHIFLREIDIQQY